MTVIKLKLIRGAEDPNSFFVQSNYGLLLFDTGAASSQLACSEKTKQLPQLTNKESHGIFGSKEQSIVTVSDLMIGDIAVPSLPVALSDTHGILGNDILRGRSFTFDTEKEEVSFIEPFQTGIRGTLGQRGHLYLSVTIGDVDTMAMVDIGASASLIDASFYHQLKEQKIARKEAGKDWTGATFETEIISLDGLCIDGISFSAHEFAVLDFKTIFPFMEYPITMILGATTLSLRKFSFNLSEGYLLVEDNQE